MVGVHGYGTAPVQRDEVPRKRAGHGANVDEARGRAVAEVGSREVGKVDDEEELGEPKVRAHPEMDESKEEKVVGDEVGADVCSRIDVVDVRGVESVGVEELKSEEDDPVQDG